VVLVTLEETYVVFSFIFAYMRVMCGGGTECPCAGPDELAMVIVDVWSGIDVSIGRKEDVSRRNEIGVQYSQVDGRSM
jgi:hypothetical protein